MLRSDTLKDVMELLKRKKNIILQGAPGVGKSFIAKKLACLFMNEAEINEAKDTTALQSAGKIEEKDPGFKARVNLVQFHQNYSYEEFVEGYKPDAGNSQFGLKREDGVFKKFCEEARGQDCPYFFIIDEINRGNFSKIMGELMLLIEADKRETLEKDANGNVNKKGESVKLSYSREDFSVPENVYIIGMMNTADRSLAMIDYALRRRFAFVTIDPIFDNKAFKDKFKTDQGVIDAKRKAVIASMKELNKYISKELGAGFQIGHSYFCPDKSDKPFSDKDIENIFKYEILPLLEEYFFDDDNPLKEALGKIYDFLPDKVRSKYALNPPKP